MSDQAEKKACGWRVRVRNVIKNVSSNRKTIKVKNEVGSLKSSKFFVPGSSTVVDRKSDCGYSMMLEAAKAEFGKTPVLRTFRGQKILVYTLPSHHRKSNFKTPTEDTTAHPIQKLESSSEPVVKEINETAPVKKNEDIENDGIPGSNANGIPDSNANVIADENFKINLDKNSAGIPDGKAMLDNEYADSELKPGGVVDEKQSAKKASLFSQPVPKENSLAEGMYFGPQSNNLHLNVK